MKQVKRGVGEEKKGGRACRLSFDAAYRPNCNNYTNPVIHMSITSQQGK